MAKGWQVACICSCLLLCRTPESTKDGKLLPEVTNHSAYKNDSIQSKSSRESYLANTETKGDEMFVIIEKMYIIYRCIKMSPNNIVKLP